MFRIALFVSHYAGRAVLEELLGMSATVRVVLVASDDPTRPCCNAAKRLWRYGRDDELSGLVPRLAAEAGLDAFTGSVRREAGRFHRRFAAAGPDAILTMVFGQRVPAHLLDQVAGRAWNLHPAIPGRPLAATAGPEPIETAYRLGAGAIQLCLHRMTPRFDDGEEVARSEPLVLPPAVGSTAERMLEIQQQIAPRAAELVRRVLPGLDPASPNAKPLVWRDSLHP